MQRWYKGEGNKGITVIFRNVFAGKDQILYFIMVCAKLPKHNVAFIYSEKIGIRQYLPAYILKERKHS
jgi:hypothetical protein